MAARHTSACTVACIKPSKGPLNGFEGNNVVVGIGPISTTFMVSVPPHQEGGDWKMTVDGVELTRKQ
jgi:hypothetical protein